MIEYTITSVQRALRLLKVFDNNRKELSLTEISKLVNLNKSSTFRILVTLEEENFVKYESETRKYKLGIELFRLGNIVSDEMDIRRIAKPYFDKAVEETGLIAHIGMVQGKDVVIIEKIVPIRFGETIAMVSRVGGVVPIHCTGVGKTILAFQDEDVVRKLLSDYIFTKYSDNTILDIDNFIKELKKIKARGYGMNNGEHEEYIKCFTFPIFNHDKNVVAAVSLTGLKEEMDKNDQTNTINILRAVSSNISRELGYNT